MFNPATYFNYGDPVDIVSTCDACGIRPNVTIGSQVWTQCNATHTAYRNGDPIPEVTDPAQWANLKTGAWCYFNNDSANNAIYGKLYNWYAVAGIYDAASLANPSLRKEFAPNGYYVPSDTDWTTLGDFLGVNEGGKMKTIGNNSINTGCWAAPNTGATNSSGFRAQPGGSRTTDGIFYSIGNNGFWWNSSQFSTRNAWARNLSYDDGNLFAFNEEKFVGMSVRLLELIF